MITCAERHPLRSGTGSAAIRSTTRDDHTRRAGDRGDPRSMTGDTNASAAWHEALTTATLFAIDPYGTGGVTLRAAHGPVRDRWLATLHAMLPAQTPVLRVPVHVSDERLLGGLDLAATLGAGRPVVERGLLATAHNGIAVFAMAERVTAGTAARVAAAMDTMEIALERDGIAERFNARFGVIALDEGMSDDERPPASLLDRLAFHLDLADLVIRDAPDAISVSVGEIEAARARLGLVRTDGTVIEALCGAAAALGIGSLRAPMLALRVARASAALAGRAAVTDDDAALAARLVLGPRATALPAASDAPEPPADDPGADTPDSTEDRDLPAEVQQLEDRVIEATVAAASRCACATATRQWRSNASRIKRPRRRDAPCCDARTAGGRASRRAAWRRSTERPGNPACGSAMATAAQQKDRRRPKRARHRIARGFPDQPVQASLANHDDLRCGPPARRRPPARRGERCRGAVARRLLRTSRSSRADRVSSPRCRPPPPADAFPGACQAQPGRASGRRRHAARGRDRRGGRARRSSAPPRRDTDRCPAHGRPRQHCARRRV